MMRLMSPFRVLKAFHGIGISYGSIPCRHGLITNTVLLGNIKDVTALNKACCFHSNHYQINTSCRTKFDKFEKGNACVSSQNSVRSKATSAKDNNIKVKKEFKTDNETQNLETEKIPVVTVKENDLVQLFSHEDLLVGKFMLSDAREYASKEGYKLVKLQGNTVNLPLSYKLVTGKMMKDFENLKRDGKKEKRKSDKTFKVGEKIEDHDLEVKIKQMIKYLNKGTTIRIKFQTNKQGSGVGPVLKKIGEKLDHIAYIQTSRASDVLTDATFVPRENLLNQAADDS